MLGQVRALFDDAGRRVDEAGPSIPVQVAYLLALLDVICLILIIKLPYEIHNQFKCKMRILLSLAIALFP